MPNELDEIVDAMRAAYVLTVSASALAVLNGHAILSLNTGLDVNPIFRKSWENKKMRKGKSLYQFVKQPEQKINRSEAIKAYSALRKLRLVVASIVNDSKGKREAEYLLAGVRHLRDRYREHMLTERKGYQVTRIFNGQELSFSMPPLGFPLKEYEDNLLGKWKEMRAQFQSSIRQSREYARNENIDRLAQRPPNYHLQKAATKMLQKRKMPVDGIHSVGIELEILLPKKSDMTQFWPVARYIDLGSDGSVRTDNNNQQAVEVRACIPVKEMQSVVTSLCVILNKMNATVNKTCSLHVHLDQRHKSDMEVKTAFINLVRSQNLLFQAVPKSRRDNTFCKKQRGTNIDSAMSNSRYKAVNGAAMRRYKTIEVRLFGGTINAEKIINWIETLWAIEKGSMILRCPKNFDIAKRYWNLSDDNIKWLKARQEKFKDMPVIDDSAIIRSEEESIHV